MDININPTMSVGEKNLSRIALSSFIDYMTIKLAF